MLCTTVCIHIYILQPPHTTCINYTRACRVRSYFAYALYTYITVHRNWLRHSALNELCVEVKAKYEVCYGVHSLLSDDVK